MSGLNNHLKGLSTKSDVDVQKQFNKRHDFFLFVDGSLFEILRTVSIRKLAEKHKTKFLHNYSCKNMKLTVLKVILSVLQLEFFKIVSVAQKTFK